MLVRMKFETDGKCFAKMGDACTVLKEKDKKCSTYNCPFYKPEGCKDWIRIDGNATVIMYKPEEKR